MSLLKILEFPDKRLRTVAEPVAEVNDDVKQLVDDMLETMYEEKGVGLAATQVNVHKRVIVIDISEEKDAPICLINPELTETEGSEESEEGCLSVPGFFEKVTRAKQIKVTALNREGESYEMEADDLLSVCIQHEIDHLDGKLFVDYISTLKRKRIKTKLEKIHRLQRK